MAHLESLLDEIDQRALRLQRSSRDVPPVGFAGWVWLATTILASAVVLLVFHII